MKMNIATYILIMIWALTGLESCRGDNRPQSAVNDISNGDATEPARVETIMLETAPTDDIPAEPPAEGTAQSLHFYFSVAEALKNNKSDHEKPEDYIWNNSETVNINLEGSSVSVSGSGAAATNAGLTITKPGTYVLSGKLNDGQVLVNSEGKGAVRLVLNGVNINCSSSAPVFVKKSDKTILILAENSDNFLTDGSDYVFEVPDVSEPNATLFSKSDLTISGRGSLTIRGNYKDGIDSNDGLVLSESQIKVTAKDNGIEGSDYLVIRGANVSVNAGGDGLKSNNDQDTARGYVYIKSGTLDISSMGDAIQAETDVLISSGRITLRTSGTAAGNDYGSAAISTKAVNAGVNAIIDGGTISVESADDALHSNANLVINGGNYYISCNDDAIHSDSTVTINKGTIDIARSYEGIEGQIITINDGNIRLVSSDDGLNAAGGNNDFGMGGGPGGAFGPGGRPGGGFGGPRGGGGGRGFGGFGGFGNYFLYVNGGRVAVDAYGDGLDINGSVVMTGGQLIVHGPTADFNSAIDYDGSFTISGGFIVAAGSARMAQVPAGNSTQNSLLLNLSIGQQAGTPFHIRNSSGEGILSFVPSKWYQSIAFSSPDLIRGETYDAYIGGNFSGKAVDGLYTDAKYNPGTKYTSFTVSSNVTGIYR